jgi:hypothetical protein
MASRFKRFLYGRFGGGINSSVPANEIADDECVDILNKEFDAEDNLITRRGVTKYCSAMPIASSSRITSLYDFTKSDGSQFLIATWAADVRSITTSAATSIKGALTLPSDTLWSWVTFNDLAIGANGASSGDAVVKWSGSGDAVALAGSPPRMKYLEIWNNRVFGVEVANPNRVSWCKLGDANDWTHATAGSIEVGYNDGETIRGIKAHRKALFIFKTKKIYIYTAGTPNTDPALWRLDTYTSNAGTVSHFSIQSVLDDLFFLGDSGVVSLAAVQSFGDFAQSFASKKVNALKSFPRSIANHYAVVDPENSQYWIAVPSSTSGTENGHVFVCDYRRVGEGRLRWTRFNGRVTGTAYAQVYASGKKRVFIGTSDNVIYRKDTVDEDGYSDASQAYSKVVQTKAYDQGDILLRKEFNRWAASIELLTCPIALTVKYRFDEKDYRLTSQVFNFTCTQDGAGGFFGDGTSNANAALWDVALWDATDDGGIGRGYLFGGDVSDESSALRDIQRKINKDNGKRGQSIQFYFFNAQNAQAFLLKDFAIDALSIGTHKVNDVR